MPATVGLFVSEPEMNIHPVYSDGSAVENRELHRTCRFVRPGEQAILQPWSSGFELVCFEKIAVALVVVVCATLKVFELLDEPFAEEGPRGLLCAPLRNAQSSVFGDGRVENAYGGKRGLRGIVAHLKWFEYARFDTERGFR